VIRIRYGDLPPGLHGKAERGARGVAVYLLPGLTSSQRKAALRRLRQEADRGCGPALPAPQLMVALGWDRVRTALCAVAAIVRLHPVASLLHAGAAGAAMTLFVLASVSVPLGTAAGSGPPAAPVAFTPSVRAHPRRIGARDAAPRRISVPADGLSRTRPSAPVHGT
jgi:hypothetical protein